MLSKHEIQLRGVFLYMAHTVELHLKETRFDPIKSTEAAPLLIR